MFVSAYFQSLQGDHVFIDTKYQYKYSQIKDLSYE
jgi:hypothetical protein